MSGQSFVLIVVDLMTREFTVEGPMTDDGPWNRAVFRVEDRTIRCFPMGDLPPDIAAAEWHAVSGGRRLAAGSIILPETYVP